MSRIVPMIAVLVPFLLAGCGGPAPEPVPVPEPEAPSEEPETDVASCPAYDPRDGSAWIDVMPGPDASPTLHVVFTVDAPNSGDAYELVFTTIQESAPPSYVFDLVRVNEGSLTVITPTEVRYSQSEFPEPELRSIVIDCEGERFYEISPVEIAH